jgi:predicted RNase H-like nuclease (RuvC/YqgF family)
MYYLKDLAQKLGVNDRTLRLYAQRKHFPSEVYGQRLAFSESVYLGLLAHVGEGKPLSTFRMKVPLNQRGEVVKAEKIPMTKKEYTSEIYSNDPDNDPDNEYVIELEEKNSQLLKEIHELKAQIRQINIDKHENFTNHLGEMRETLPKEYVEKEYIYRFTHEAKVKRLEKTIDRLEARIERMSRTPQPTDILGAVAPPLIQMAEKWLTHKRETLGDQAIKSQTMNNTYRGGFEPRVNPEAKLKGNLPKEDYYDPLTGL